MNDIIEINWDGPYSINEINKFIDKSDFGIYQIYGTHIIYGNSLLYIGKASENEFGVRIMSHISWIEKEPLEVEIYLGRIGCNEYNYNEAVKKWSELIQKAERLLIFAISPAYNSSGLNISFDSNYTVRNFGKRNKLPYEISTSYFNSDYFTQNWKPLK